MVSERVRFSLASDRYPTSFEGPGHWDGQRPLTAKAHRRIALYPILFFQIYLGASVLIFAFGPWPWPVSNPWLLYSFLFVAQAALFGGYWSAIRSQPHSASTRLRVPLLVIVSLAFNFLWIGQTYKNRTGDTASDVNAAVSAVDAGLSDPGQKYDEKLKNNLERGEGVSTIRDYITLPLYPVLWIGFPLGVFFWNRLSVRVRAALVGWIIVDLSMWVAAGTNKGIADFVILLPCLLIARNPAMLTKIRLRNVLLIGFIAVTGAAALFAFFSLGLLGRSGGNLDLMHNSAAGISADSDNIALRYLPLELQGQAASFASYFSQGYYGLSLSLDQPFVFCYGVGNSYFMEGLSRRFVSAPIGLDSYPARIEGTGWGRFSNWHSIYPWIASDLSFPGTIVFMFVIGRLFALVWLDVAFCRNPWAVCLLTLLLMMLFYAPANNQVLAFAEEAIPFWTLLFLWSFSRARAGKRKMKSTFGTVPAARQHSRVQALATPWKA